VKLKAAPDVTAKLKALDGKRERTLDLFTNGDIDRIELNARLGKLDAARHKLEAEQAAATKPSLLADARVRREMLSQVKALGTAWKHNTPEERREIVNLIALSVGIRVGKPPAFTWRSTEEMAESV
jgi:hypothetical protein